MTGICFVVVKSFQSVPLLVSVVITKEKVSGSVDRCLASGDPLLVSVKTSVCSVSVE